MYLPKSFNISAMRHKINFKWSLTGLKLVSFFLTGGHTTVKVYPTILQ